MTENVSQLKKALRKELREGIANDIMTDNHFTGDFNVMTRQLIYLDDIRSKIENSTRAAIQNDLLKNSPMYPDILEMMRDREEDKKKTARYIKKALIGEGYEADAITEASKSAIATHPTYQLFDVSKMETEKRLLRILLQKPVWTKYLVEVKGISVLTASKLLYYINDVTRFSQPSKLVKYSGLAVEDGESQRKKRGELCNYKPDLKSLLLGVMGDVFIKSNSQYRRIYDERSEVTKQTHPEWWHMDEEGEKLTTANKHPKHGYRDAIRVMMKRFLHEFWDNAWLLSGVQPPSKPYAVAILGHDMEPKVVPVNSERGLIYSWNESGVLDKDRRILYGWGEWQQYVDNLHDPVIIPQ